MPSLHLCGAVHRAGSRVYAAPDQSESQAWPSKTHRQGPKFHAPYELCFSPDAIGCFRLNSGCQVDSAYRTRHCTNKPSRIVWKPLRLAFVEERTSRDVDRPPWGANSLSSGLREWRARELIARINRSRCRKTKSPGCFLSSARGSSRPLRPRDGRLQSKLSVPPVA